MQLLMNISRLLMLAGLSMSLLLAWDANQREMTTLSNAHAYENTTNIVEHVTPVTKKTSPAPKIKAAHSIWNTMGRDLNLNHQANSPRVQAEIRKLLADKNNLYRILRASEPYMYFIYQQTQERKLPAELALIPVIESEFNPNNLSNRGALGLWQLMPETARILGVKIKAGYDGRRNVIASTKAALTYFRDLRDSFKGDWYLALAAYNCGQMKIYSAERRVNSHDFWQLPLPKETRYYVPKLLAVAEIIKNPGKYNVKLPVMGNQPFFTELKIKSHVSLKQVATTSGMKLAELQVLNPDYRGGVLVSKGGYKLLVPTSVVGGLSALVL